MEKGLKSLKDLNAATKINVPIKRMQEGDFGDVKPVGGRYIRNTRPSRSWIQDLFC